MQKALSGRMAWWGSGTLVACESAAVAAGGHDIVASAVERAGDVHRGRAVDGRSRSDVHRRRSSPGSSARNI